MNVCGIWEIHGRRFKWLHLRSARQTLLASLCQSMWRLTFSLPAIFAFLIPKINFVISSFFDFFYQFLFNFIASFTAVSYATMLLLLSLFHSCFHHSPTPRSFTAYISPSVSRTWRFGSLLYSHHIIILTDLLLLSLFWYSEWWRFGWKRVIQK